MIDKSKIPGSLREIIENKFAKRARKKLVCVKIRDAELARALYLSNDSSDFAGKYDAWMNLTEGDRSRAAMEGISISRRQFFNYLITASIDNFERVIKHYGGFPGGVAKPIDVAQDFSAIFLYAMATIDNGTAERLYEDMFLAYQSGGWPCGWLGKYPEGKIVVFYPS